MAALTLLGDLNVAVARLLEPIELAFELVRYSLRALDLLFALRGDGLKTCFFS